MKSQSNWIPSAQILAAGVGFGFLGVFGKLAFASGLTVGELLTWRFFSATVVLGLILSITQPKRMKIESKQFLICLFLGAFGYAVFSTLYFMAVEGVSVSLAALLLYTFPVLVSVGARVFLHEHLSFKQWLAVPAAALGLLALLWGDLEIRSWASVAFGLGAALAYATYILVSRHWQREISPLTSGFYVMLSATVALALFHRPPVFQLFELTPSQWGYILGLAVISTIGPMIFFLSGLQNVSAAKASILSTIEPVTATLLSALIFSEPLRWAHLAGGGGILLAVIFTVQEKANDKRS